MNSSPSGKCHIKHPESLHQLHGKKGIVMHSFLRCLADVHNEDTRVRVQHEDSFRQDV